MQGKLDHKWRGHSCLQRPDSSGRFRNSDALGTAAIVDAREKREPGTVPAGSVPMCEGRPKTGQRSKSTAVVFPPQTRIPTRSPAAGT